MGKFHIQCFLSH